MSGKWPSCIKNTVSQPFSKLYLRSRYMGEVQGMITMKTALDQAREEGQRKGEERRVGSDFGVSMA